VVDLAALQDEAERAGRRCAVGALIRDADGRVFVHRRGPERRVLPGCWDIPGGHVEAGERLVDALAREVAEETGWRLTGEPRLVFVSDWETSEGATVDARREFDFLAEVDGDLSRPQLERPQHVEFAWVDRDTIDLVDENRGADDGLIRRLVTSALYWPTSDELRYPHATLFLRGPAATPVERVRREWDPVMAGHVAAHVTVAYPRDVDDVEELRRRTSAAAEELGHIRIELGDVEHDPAHGTVYLGVRDPDGGLARLRRAIAGEDASRGWTPHVTLVHPRTTNRGPAAWEHLRGTGLDGGLAVTEVAVTALRRSRWLTVDSWTLAGPAAGRAGAGGRLELRERRLEVVEEVLEVRDRPTAPGQPEAHPVRVARRGDVEGLPVGRDRGGVGALEQRTVPVQVLARAGHVRDDDVERRPPERLEAVQRSERERREAQRAEDDHPERREPLEAELAGLGGAVDQLEARQRVFEVGAEVAEDQPDGVARTEGVVAAQRDGDHGDERPVGEPVEVEEVTVQRPGAHREDHVVQRPVERLREGPHPLEGPVVGGETSRAGDGHVERRRRCLVRDRCGLVLE
jgi:8-oxo-dGTP diphosphatase